MGDRLTDTTGTNESALRSLVLQAQTPPTTAAATLRILFRRANASSDPPAAGHSLDNRRASVCVHREPAP